MRSAFGKPVMVSSLARADLPDGPRGASVDSVGDPYDAPHTTYVIQLTDEAVYGYADIASTDLCDRIDRLIEFLEDHPYYGQVYDPYYEASRPPVPCRVFYCGHVGVYYHVNDPDRIITVFAMVNQRRNPLGRFKIVIANEGTGAPQTRCSPPRLPLSAQQPVRRRGSPVVLASQSAAIPFLAQ